MKIEKKIWPEYFDKVASGEKTFEVRLADWECSPGDILLLREWDPKTKEYTGRTIEKRATYVLKTKSIDLWPAEDIEKYGFQIIAIEATKKRHKVIPAAYVFLYKKEKVLLARRLNTGYMDGTYQPPAGHVEESEMPMECAIREAKEEVGVNLEEKDLTLVHITSRRKHDDTGDRIDFFFKAKEWEGKVENLEPEKCDNLLWANPDELPPNVGPHIRHVLGEIKKGNFYSEFDPSKSNA